MRISDWSSDVCSSDLIAQQFDSIELIHAEGALDVQVVRHVHERQRRQVVANQWNIGSQSRSTLVDVVERLQVRQLHHREERLLERILDRLRLGQQRVEVLLDLLRYRQRDRKSTRLNSSH